MIRYALVLWLAICAAAPAAAQQAYEVPGGTRLPVRLRQPVSSFGSDRGQRVTVELLAPVDVDGRALLPIGSLIHGHVEGVTCISLGARRPARQARRPSISAICEGGATQRGGMPRPRVGRAITFPGD